MYTPFRPATAAAALLALSGCAWLPPQHDAIYALGHFGPLPADSRIYYEPGAWPYAERVALVLPEAIAQVERRQYQPFAKPVAIYVCGSEECFARYVPHPPNLTAAVVFENRLLLAPRLFTREPERLYPILVHELSHLHLGQRLGHYTMAIPVWFHEGLAALVADGGGADLAHEEDAALAAAAGRHFVPDAAHEAARRKNAEHWGLKITLFYRQAMMFVAHLKARGEARFRAFVLALQRGGDFDAAFMESFGASAAAAAREFFGSLRSVHAAHGAKPSPHTD